MRNKVHHSEPSTVIAPPAILFILLFIILSISPIAAQTQKISVELKKLELLDDSIKIVNTLNQLGTLYRNRNADSVFFYGIAAKQMANTINYKKGQMDADLVIANALFKKGLYAESLETLGKALSYYQKTKDSEQIVRTYLDIIEVENKGISDRPRIISLVQKAIQAGKKLENDSLMAEVYISYINRGPDISHDSVTYYLGKSMEIAKRYKNERIVDYIRLWQARLLILDNQLEKSLPLVKELIKDTQRTGNTSLEINALFLMTGFHEDEPKKVLEYFYEAYEISRKSADRSLQIYILQYALDAAKKLDNTEELIKVYKELDKAITADWENSKKFMGDYIRYNTIEQENKGLNKENERQEMWIVNISFIALTSIMAIYMIMLRRSRKANERIEDLNNAANMQIIAMEEIKHEAISKEQQRLGQDLHDSLSSSIAGIKHQLETLSLDVEDPKLKKRFEILLSALSRSYAIARNKSHEWFYTNEGQHGDTFEQRIRYLTDAALPDSHYDISIHIDEHALIHASTDNRIGLLRIIQEAITNILKHAKAQKVEILIYEELTCLILTIKDNGKGMVSKKLTEKSSLGLQSIKRRVHAMDGEIDIVSGAGGTELTISIPLNPS